jgi:hypothetical protein
MTVPDASQGTTTIYLVNGQQCSQGTGPGPVTGVPWDEAKALVDAGYAVYGQLPPAGLLGPWPYIVEQA